MRFGSQFLVVDSILRFPNTLIQNRLSVISLFCMVIYVWGISMKCTTSSFTIFRLCDKEICIRFNLCTQTMKEARMWDPLAFSKLNSLITTGMLRPWNQWDKRLMPLHQWIQTHPSNVAMLVRRPFKESGHRETQWAG